MYWYSLKMNVMLIELKLNVKAFLFQQKAIKQLFYAAWTIFVSSIYFEFYVNTVLQLGMLFFMSFWLETNGA